MKIFLKVIVIILVLLGSSCGGDSSGIEPTPTPEPENVAPTTPTLKDPTNNLLCIDNVLDFQWNASTDSNGDAITYKIDVAKDNQFSDITHTTTTTSTSHSFTLEKGIAYYWRVKATDSKNESSNYSSTFNLYTEGEGVTNHLPFSPELVLPLINTVETQGTTTLEWKGSDTDGDPLTYDVYFDENTPPTTLVSENQSEQTMDVTTISAKNYYWKIVVKDDKGGQSIGQVWGFSTN